MGIDTTGLEKAIEGKMMGLMKELSKLAPHPNKPEHKGPLFVQISSEHEPPAEYEGMLGSMMMETVLSTAFSGATSNSENGLDITNLMDAASEYITDRAPRSYVLGKKGSIMQNFNSSAQRAILMKAFIHDLPARLGLEKWLAYYQRRLYALRKAHRIAAPSFAA